ncbi:hypothetical protein [Bradyrhizobium elkanii]|uniref:hypothetical protein n=1 Tax=Bradyrhizobium elkanii TaxID=29448 RepID=UPI003BAC4DD0
MHARGDAVMQIDADLQDPPELLAEFFDLWRSGHRVVYGIRSRRAEGAAVLRPAPFLAKCWRLMSSARLRKRICRFRPSHSKSDALVPPARPSTEQGPSLFT